MFALQGIALMEFFMSCISKCVKYHVFVPGAHLLSMEAVISHIKKCGLLVCL
jgi:hypothetical protein